MSRYRIVLLGDGVETWLYAALLAQLLRGHAAIVVVPTEDRQVEIRDIALPPDAERAHRLLRIAPSMLMSFGRPRYGIRIRTVDGREILIPYGMIGDPEMAGDFCDIWIRSRVTGDAEPWQDYSANLQLLRNAASAAAQDQRVRHSVAAGWDLAPEPYRLLLEQAARARGVERIGTLRALSEHDSKVGTIILDDGTILDADLVVAAQPALPEPFSSNPIGWRDNLLTLAAVGVASFEPFEIATVISSAARLVGLLPRRGAEPWLSVEYNRLLAVERQGMEMAEAVLARLAGREASSDGLDRHISRYREAGLLPHHPLPWSRDIWLACLDSLGVVPGRYNPNTDRAALVEAKARMSRWRGLIATN